MTPKTKTQPATPPGPQLLDIEVASLAGHPRNVRRSVGDVTELAASIEERGVLEPLVVAPAGDGTYVVIAGHRRLAAAQQACVTEVPCIVRHDITEDVDVVTAMLVENLMRSDLSAVEEAEAYQQLEMAGVKPAQIAQRTGRSKATVTSRLALMRLPEATRDKVHGHQLNLEEAATLLEFADDPAVVARLEQVAGTPNWRWELQTAKQARDIAIRTEQTLTALAEAGCPVVANRDLKRGAWMHNLGQVLDDDTIPAITDDSSPEDDDEARRAAHATCPHHAAYLNAGFARYVCLEPTTHAAAGAGDDDEPTDADDE
ncbi:ParB/RepB/Spo0J family partition protein, partial [Kineosporia sp. R_H_3]|uniref:ParB/RepB/Spo0J family partition protein n=1 Tax=Kineosporia sp. R_H_3 TaxID=1961848 RepID=UPI003510242A